MADEISLDVKKQYIAKQACFDQLTAEEKEMLASLLVQKQFLAGQTIVKEGEPVDSVYLIISGEADVRNIRIINQAPQIKSITTLGKDDAIGLNETGFYSLTGRRTATVVALTDLVALYLSVAAFHGFALEFSHVNEVMHKQAEEFLKS